jgi:2-haloacid dehalogenase
MDRVIVFDVNETLLDISALRPDFERVFGDGDALSTWFQQVLQYSLAVTLAGLYFDFSAIGGAALAMLAEARGVALPEDDKRRIVEGMLSLPPHPDAAPGLMRLKQAGLRLATLTNSSPAAVQKQLGNAGLDSFFEKSISVESVRRYKPAPEAYRRAASELGVSTEQIRLVAAHAWDVLGAMQAGCATAFVARRGKVLFPLAQKPGIVGPDLQAVCEQILAIDAPHS